MYSSEEICPAYHDDEFLALDPASLARYRYFAGHLWLHPLTMLPEPPAVVTIVRDPVTHLRSHYDHSRREVGDARPGVWGLSFTDWLRADATRRVNENFQARCLVGVFGAGNATAPYDDDELYERAVATLEGCLWYSTTECLESSIGSLATALRWPAPARLRHANVAPVAAPAPTPEERELIDLRCPVDVRLHRYVQSRVGRDRQVGRREFGRALDEASRPLDRSLVVELDHRFWGSGWLPPEAFWHRDSAVRADHACRWMAANEPASIDLPVQLRPGDRIDLFVSQAVPTSIPGLSVEVNGHAAQKLPEYWRPPHIVVPVVVTECNGRHTRLTLCAKPEPGQDRSHESLTIEGRVVAVERLVLVPSGAR
jgi:hypothetical protein